jgi:hypothetical protein
MPEVEGTVDVEWWQEDGGRGGGKLAWWCRETTASMAPALLRFQIRLDRVV